MTSAGSDGREEPLDENGLVSMESLAREHRGRQRDVMIVLTDLPPPRRHPAPTSRCTWCKP
jgi:hypothetical protein